MLFSPFNTSLLVLFLHPALSSFPYIYQDSTENTHRQAGRQSSQHCPHPSPVSAGVTSFPGLASLKLLLQVGRKPTMASPVPSSLASLPLLPHPKHTKGDRGTRWPSADRGLRKAAAHRGPAGPSSLSKLLRAQPPSWQRSRAQGQSSAPGQPRKGPCLPAEKRRMLPHVCASDIMGMGPMTCQNPAFPRGGRKELADW